MEKSSSEASGACTRAVLRPDWTITLPTFTNTSMIASIPNCSGASSRAMTICTTSSTTALPPLSKNFQKRDEIVDNLRFEP